MEGSAAQPRLAPEIQDHPSFKGKVFYTLPGELLECLRSGPRPPEFNGDLWQLEISLSALNGDHSQRVGFINGVPLASRLLAGEPIKSGGNSAAWRNVRAYAGWLLRNRDFIEEHAAVWEGVRAIFTADGLMPFSTAIFFVGELPRDRVHENESRVADAVRALAEHCSRWRLLGIQGPY